MATPGDQIVWAFGPVLPLHTTYVWWLVHTLSSSFLDVESVPVRPLPAAPPLMLMTWGGPLSQWLASDMKSMPLSIHAFCPVPVLPQILAARMRFSVLPTPGATPR